MLRLPVLVRGINNLSDARYCAGMGADGLIFTLDPTLPGAVDAATVKELASWVAGIELIGEFGKDAPAAEINRLTEECSLDKVVLSALRPSWCQTDEDWSIRNTAIGAPILWLEEFSDNVLSDNSFSDSMWTEVLHLRWPLGEGVIVTTQTDVTLYEEAVRALASVASKRNLWLGAGINALSVLQLVEKIQPAGLILSGGDELKPGLRDFTELEAIFEALEE